MFAAGCHTALMSFIVVGLSFGFWTLLNPNEDLELPMRLFMIAPATVIVVILGSIKTLGIPYLLLGLTSLLFAEWPYRR